MKRISVVLLVSLLLFLLPAAPAQGASAALVLPSECFGAVLPSPGGITTEVYCIPANWNHDLVIFAHGYMKPSVPVGTIPEDQLVIDGQSVPGLVMSLGYAFATTSYRANGLVVLDAVQDVQLLAQHFGQYTLVVGQTPPTHTYLIGASEGGLVTTLALERSPAAFSGGLAMCGPIGDFRQQINYWGDFRAIFDTVFQGQNLLPPTAISVPPATIANWPTAALGVAYAISQPQNSANLDTLLKVSKAPYDTADPTTKVKTVMGLLDYNVNATNNGKEVLQGNPFDNRFKYYSGSSNDRALNAGVVRYSADAAPLNNLKAYQTSGKLSKPLVTLHTTGDEIVPYWHEALYTAKTLANNSFFKRVNIPILRYGHCNFKASEVLMAFSLLKYKVTGSLLKGAEMALPAAQRADFQRLTTEQNIVPQTGAADK